jgi:uncharacterized protein Veg
MDEEPITKQVAYVNRIHKTLIDMKGKRLRVRANLGRSKIIEREGTLMQAHNSLFIMEVDEKRGRKARQSFQYVDVLTGTVELTDLDNGARLFPELQEEIF